MRLGERLVDLYVYDPAKPEIQFTVYGRPMPQGSKKHVGRGIMVESCKGLKPWRQEISGAAMEATSGLVRPVFAQHVPLEITLRFFFTRPKSVSVKKRPSMTTKPDGSKLLRAVEDSLTGVVFHDDAQLIEFHIRKMYGGPERVEIEVREAIA